MGNRNKPSGVVMQLGSRASTANVPLPHYVHYIPLIC